MHFVGGKQAQFFAEKGRFNAIISNEKIAIILMDKTSIVGMKTKSCLT